MNRNTVYGPPEAALDRVKRALRARRYHSEYCANNACDDCDKHDEAVRTAKHAYIKVCGDEGRIAR